MLENAQVMRLKKQGYIVKKRFVKQPTQEVIDEALRAGEDKGFNGIMKAFGFGKSSDFFDDDLLLEDKAIEKPSTDATNGGLLSGVSNAIFRGGNDATKENDSATPETGRSELVNGIGNALFGSSSDDGKVVAVSQGATDALDKSTDKIPVENGVVAETSTLTQIKTSNEAVTIDKKSEAALDNGVEVEAPAIAQSSAAFEAIPVAMKTETETSNIGGEYTSGDYFTKLFGSSD